MPDFYTTTRAHWGAKPGVSPLVSSGTRRRIQGVLDTPWKRVELFRHAQSPAVLQQRGFAYVFRLPKLTPMVGRIKQTFASGIRKGKIILEKEMLEKMYTEEKITCLQAEMKGPEPNNAFDSGP